MTASVFVDTNVLVYDQDLSDTDKHATAHLWVEHLWRSRRARLSAQVLSEYYLTVTRKLIPGRPRELARADVRDLEAWRPIPLDAPLLASAWAVEELHTLSWWDALIVAAAQQAGCRYLLTEDLQDGQTFDRLTVLNPFVHGIEAIA